MNKPERTIRKFNPGTFQSDEEIIEQFVVRNRELGTVLETLRGNIESPSCQHVLVIASRGRGKTMLLARTATEIRTNEALSNRLFPVRFMEESQEIFNMTDFWLETLFQLAREVSPSDSESSYGIWFVSWWRSTGPENCTKCPIDSFRRWPSQ